VDGYVGHSAGVQLLALISVAMLAASVVPDYRNRFPNADSADP
jgi:arabinofuranan 3-O-arabinosyltransferase